MENSDAIVRPKDEVVFERDNFQCVYCGFDGRTFKGWAFLQVDHFKPASRSGSDELINLVTSCMLCNHMKGAADFPSIEEARAEMSRWWNQMHEYWTKNVKGRVKDD